MRSVVDDVEVILAPLELAANVRESPQRVDRPPAATDAIALTPKYNQPILTARLDLLPQAGDLALATAGQDVDLEVELVKQTAVVCDLCSSLSSQRPACVDQCPHEAAIRVDARFEFPSYS